MTRSHGRLAQVFIDDASSACQEVSGDLTSVTFNTPKALAESTTLGKSTIHREVDGLRDGSMEISALFSSGVSACVVELLEGMYSGSDYRRVQYFPGGLFGASPNVSACMNLTNYSNPEPVDGISTLSATLEVAASKVLLSNVYAGKVLATAPDNLIAYWPIWELSGTTIDNLEGTAARDGTYDTVALGRPGIGDGHTSACFDGASSFGNIYSTSLNTAFNGSEGTALIWLKVSGVGVWTDGEPRRGLLLEVDGNNKVQLYNFTNSGIAWEYKAGGTSETITKTSVSDVDWMQWAITWTDSGSAVKAYFNGTQEGSTQTSLGTFVGDLATTTTVAGARSTVPVNVWDGLIAHVAVWDTPLTADQISNLATPT